MSNLTLDKTQYYLLQLLFGLCAVAFGCVIISPNFSIKVFSVAGIVALVAFLLDIKNFKNMMHFGCAWCCLSLVFAISSGIACLR